MLEDGDAGALSHLEERRGGSGPGSGSSSWLANVRSTSERSKSPRPNGAPDTLSPKSASFADASNRGPSFVGDAIGIWPRLGNGGGPLARADRGGVMSSGEPKDIVPAASFVSA